MSACSCLFSALVSLILSLFATKNLLHLLLIADTPLNRLIEIVVLPDADARTHESRLNEMPNQHFQRLPMPFKHRQQKKRTAGVSIMISTEGLTPSASFARKKAGTPVSAPSPKQTT